jgi:hypothetical protein
MRTLQKDFVLFGTLIARLDHKQSQSQIDLGEQVAKFNGQMQSQTDLIHRISQGLQELKVATAEMRVEERVDELRAQLTDDLQTKIDMVLAEQIDCQKSVCQNLNAIRQECMQDQLSTMRTNVNFFKFMATAQLKQRQPEPACGCFKFLMRGKTKAVTQPQPEPDFIAEHEQLIEDLARKFCQGAEHMSRDLSASLSGEGGGSFFGASLSGKGGGKSGGNIFDGPASPGSIFGGKTGGDHGTL